VRGYDDDNEELPRTGALLVARFLLKMDLLLDGLMKQR
jgi:hypothetical protein